MATASRSPSPEFSPLAIGEDFSPLPEIKVAGDTALDFGGHLSAPLKLHEDLKSGCGGQTWPAGMVLAKHMLRYHKDKLHDARILELGAGGGLVGLAVAQGCSLSQRLMLTDMVDMLSLMEHNIVLNDLQKKAEALILNWQVVPWSLPRFSGEPLPTEVTALKPNVILAADCVYFEPAFPLLLTTLNELLALCPSAVVYFCFKKRRRADMQFLRKAQKQFKVEEVADEDRPVFSRQQLFLYTFRSRKAG